MGINKEAAKKAEKIARRMAKEVGYPSSMWELFLIEAYKELYSNSKDYEQ